MNTNMRKDKLSLVAAGALLVLVQVANIFLLGPPSGVGADTWIPILLSIVGIVPFMMLYARLVHLMPGKDLFQMIEHLFGKVAAVLLAIFYAYYFITHTSIVRGNFAEFLRGVSLGGTPLIVICLFLLVVDAYLVRSGTETLGKWSKIILFFLTLVLIVTVLFSISDMQIHNIMPVMGYTFPEIGRVSVKLLFLPIGEAVVLLTMAGDLEKKVNPYKLFIGSSLVTVIICLIVFLQICGIIGGSMMDNAYYPLHKATSVVHIGQIGTRIEALVTFMYILAGVTKVAASLTASAKAVAVVCREKDYHPLVYPVGLLTLAVSVIAFYNVVDMINFTERYYGLYAIIPQMIIPLTIWVTAEVKFRIQKTPIQKVWKDAEQSEPESSDQIEVAQP